MKCAGCYREKVEGYCLPCRKKLFDGRRVPHVLPFKAPQHMNRYQYQEQIKRLSISGAQLKYSLRLEGNILTLTEEKGQYILKPIPPSIIAKPEQAPENEHLTMQIAEQIFNMRVAANALIYFEGGEPAYITRRFDVKADDTRHLQEDMAQLSGRSKKTNGENFKYTGTYEDIGGLIKRYVAAYMPAIEVFFKNVFFNYLFSNGDAHLKNFSLIQAASGEHMLTPSYDLMATIIHTPGETDTALDLFEGDYMTPNYEIYGCFGYPDFMDLAMRMGIVENRARRMITDMISHGAEVHSMVNGSYLSPETKTEYLRYYDGKITRIKPA